MVPHDHVWKRMEELEMLSEYMLAIFPNIWEGYILRAISRIYEKVIYCVRIAIESIYLSLTYTQTQTHTMYIVCIYQCIMYGFQLYLEPFQVWVWYKYWCMSMTRMGRWIEVCPQHEIVVMWLYYNLWGVVLAWWLLHLISSLAISTMKSSNYALFPNVFFLFKLSLWLSLGLGSRLGL